MAPFLENTVLEVSEKNHVRIVSTCFLLESNLFLLSSGDVFD